MQGLEKQEERNREILKFQLGRKTLHPIVKIVRRCKRGFPQVILNLPTKDGKVWFPTIFWLTCPYLHHILSEIENMGMIKKIEMLIENSVWFRREFLKDQRICMEKREELFSFLKIWDPYGRFFFKRGIGGVTNYQKVKCLHLHYAFFLAMDRGVVGELIMKILRKEGKDPLDCGNYFNKFCERRQV